MRFDLKDYQRDAVVEILRNLADARDDHRRRGRLTAFALSATTGAGKTVMAAAVIEALFRGSEEYEVEADPGAVVLWVTDDPSLNEQTRHRIIESADQLDLSRLMVIGSNGFDQEKLDPGNVYFLNVQKLGSATTWVKHSDTRSFTLWETIKNTIEDQQLALYLVLDEAHRGMRPPNRRREEEQSRSTIVQRLVNGHEDVPPAPIVWGISATVERFTEAMTRAQSHGRTTYPAVQVDPRRVQESGLLKDTILLDFPDEEGAFETTLLRDAVAETQATSANWAGYAEREGLPEPVLPLLVMQVPNSPSDAELTRYLDVIYESWPELGEDGVANVFGEHTDLTLGRHRVPYIAPQDVQEATHVRVLLAKDAISTGWDCPRAEVIFSLRPAVDRTYITQLIGRMVRTPLARRIESDPRLNAVACYLPKFEERTATEVAKVLTGEVEDPGDPDSAANAGTGRRALTSPVTMVWNAQVPEEIRDLLASLPSEAAPKGEAKPIKRLLSLAAAIAVDRLLPDANSAATEGLFGVLRGQMAQHEYAVGLGAEGIFNAEVRRITSSIAEGSIEATTREVRADERTVDDAFRTSATRALGAAMANGFAKKLAMQDDEFDITTAKAKVAALLSIEGVREAVEAAADKQAKDWLDQFRPTIRGLREERRVVYEELRLQTRDPQPVEIVPPVSRIENTKDADGNLSETQDRHILADEDGRFPVEGLNPWEREVVDTELSRVETIAWYRNPSSSTSEAMQVPYKLGNVWKSMQPDFVFFTRNQDGTLAASIVDPHSDHLADALPKLRGLARFADLYGDRFARIDAVSQVDRKELRVLDLKLPEVRAAIHAASTAAELYRSDVAAPYI